MPDFDAHVDRLISALKRPADVQYFFDKLTSPAWIEALNKRGLFQNPPPQIDVEGGYVRFPVWPAAQYLARMAGREPELVASILRSILTTTNPRVQDDVATAALAMPPALAAQFVPAIASWLSSSYLLQLPRLAGELVAHLARGGQTSPALRLAKALLAPAEPAAEGSTPLQRSTRLRSRFGTWEYQHIAQQMLPSIVDVAPKETVAIVADELESGIRDAVAGAVSPDDLSWVWRSTIEPSDQNLSSDDIRNILVDLLRDAAALYIEADNSALSEVVADLESRSWNIFNRIALHLLRLNFPIAWEEARQRAMDRRRMADVAEYHEYWLLVRDIFPRLDPLERQMIVDAIMAGPPDDANSTPDERNAWSVRRLAVLKDVLDPEHRRLYDELIASTGEPEHPELLTYFTGMWVGSKSPKRAAEILEMTENTIVAYLREWEATGGFAEPSYEGLNQEFTQAVAIQPERFSAMAKRLQEVPALFIGGAIRGWSQAFSESRNFLWEPILDLCNWVINDGMSVHIVDREPENDPRGPDVGIEIARLLGAGLKDVDNQVPFSLRFKVWSALEALTHDTDSPRRGGQERVDAIDAVTQCINTTRGEAVHGVIRYALWVHRNTTRGVISSTERRLPAEVRIVLDTHLDVSLDRSVAIRSAYGQWLPTLVFLDQTWVRERLAAIFPKEPNLAYLRNVAWDAYILLAQPYNDVFQILRDEYVKAVSRIDRRHPPSSDPDRDVTTRLGYHLVTMYLRGKEPLFGGLIDGFFNRAPVEGQEKTLATVGQMFRRSDEIPNDVVERAQSLWRARTSAAGTGRSGDEPAFSAFGWWLTSGKFPESWAVDELVDALRRTGGSIDIEHAVFEYLAECAERFPRQAVDATRLIADGDQQGWALSASFDEVRIILAAGLSSDDELVKDDAQTVIHRLGARGFYQLRTLLR